MDVKTKLGHKQTAYFMEHNKADNNIVTEINIRLHGGFDGQSVFRKRCFRIKRRFN